MTLALRFSVYLGCAYSEMGDQARALAALTEATEIAEGSRSRSRASTSTGRG